MEISLVLHVSRDGLGIRRILDYSRQFLAEQQPASIDSGNYTVRLDWESMAPTGLSSDEEKLSYLERAGLLLAPVWFQHETADPKRGQCSPEVPAGWVAVRCAAAKPGSAMTIAATILWDVPALTGVVVDAIRRLAHGAVAVEAIPGDKETFDALWSAVPSAEWPSFAAILRPRSALAGSGRPSIAGASPASAGRTPELLEPEDVFRSVFGTSGRPENSNREAGARAADAGPTKPSQQARYPFLEGRLARPWERIEDRDWDRVALELWCQGVPTEKIARRVKRSADRVRARMYELRKRYGARIVPKRRG